MSTYNEIIGSAGADALVGTAGADRLAGGAGNDRLEAQDGDDRLDGGDGSDTLIGGAGIDLADYETTGFAWDPLTLNLETGVASRLVATDRDLLQGIENVRGSPADDQITGTADANRLWGGKGNDRLLGQAYAGSPSAHLQPALGGDWIEGGEGEDTVQGGAGNDTLYGGSTAPAGPEIAKDYFHFLATGNGVDLLADFSRGDRIFVGQELAIAPVLAGDGTTVRNYRVERATSGGLTTLFVDTNGAAGAEVTIRIVSPTALGELRVIREAYASMIVFGEDESTSYRQYLHLTSRADFYDAGTGDDAILGEEGNDSLFGGEGDDELSGGIGDDLLDGGPGSDWVSFMAFHGVVVDLAAGRATDDRGGQDALISIENVEGTQYADRLQGDTADNRFRLWGDDTVLGGEGHDTIELSPIFGAVLVDLHAGFYQYTFNGVGGQLTSIESLIASGSSDRIYLGNTGGLARGDFGADWIVGGDGDDTLAGEAQLDTLTGGVGNDTFVVDGYLDTDLVTDFSPGDVLRMQRAHPTSALRVSHSAEFTDVQVAWEWGTEATVRLAGHYLAEGFSVTQADALTAEVRYLLPAPPRPLLETRVAGVAREGETLTASYEFNAEADTGTVQWQWYANRIPIAGATLETFIPDVTMAGKTITVGATYSVGADSLQELRSIDTAPVEHINRLPEGDLLIAGRAIAGRTLGLTNGLSDPDGLGPLSAVQWLADGSPITGAMGETYTLGALDVGKVISAHARYTDGFGTEELVSSKSGATVTAPASALQGQVYHWKGHELLADVEITVNSGGVIQSAVTGEDGSYEFDELLDSSFDLMASRAALDTGSAVSSADALAALRIAVGVNPNPDPDFVGPQRALALSPYQVIAADVNEDGKVTSADALAILRMAVKISTLKPNWTLVAENVDLWNEATQAPLLTAKAAAPSQGAQGIAEGTWQSMVGVLRGDVNGSWTPSAAARDLDTAEPEYFRILAAQYSAPTDVWGF